MGPRVGKRVNTNSWAKLPPHIVLRIAEWTLISDVKIPGTWRSELTASSQRLWFVLKVTEQLCNLASVCTRWDRALAVHNIYREACWHLDPFGFPVRASHPGTTAVSWKYHYATLVSSCCLPCRLNNPQQQIGIGWARTLARSTMTNSGYVACCPSHSTRPFCGSCLKDDFSNSPSFAVRGAAEANGLELDAIDDEDLDTDLDYDPDEPEITASGITMNEDPLEFPDVQDTCFNCRREALHNFLSRHMGRERLARVFTDSHSRRISTDFTVYGEGSVESCKEELDTRAWFAYYTPYDHIFSQAKRIAKRDITGSIPSSSEGHLESSRTGISGRAASPAHPAVSSESNTADLYAPNSLKNFKQLSLEEWARSRILDGLWFSPMDLYHVDKKEIENAMRCGSRHPLEGPDSPTMHRDRIREQEGGVWSKPPLARHLENIPPPENALEMAEEVYRLCMKALLLPALTCIARRVAMTPGRDAYRIALKMQFKDLWWHVFDPQCWLSNELAPPSPNSTFSTVTPHDVPQVPSPIDHDNRSEIVDTPSDSRGSAEPSPTTTLKDSPSPKSLIENGSECTSPSSPALALLPQAFVDPIPRIPAHPNAVSESTRWLITQLWREAVTGTGIFFCSCSICERARLAQVTSEATQAPVAKPAGGRVVLSTPVVQQAPMALPTETDHNVLAVETLGHDIPHVSNGSPASDTSSLSEVGSYPADAKLSTWENHGVVPRRTESPPKRKLGPDSVDNSAQGIFGDEGSALVGGKGNTNILSSHEPRKRRRTGPDYPPGTDLKVS